MLMTSVWVKYGSAQLDLVKKETGATVCVGSACYKALFDYINVVSLPLTGLILLFWLYGYATKPKAKVEDVTAKPEQAGAGATLLQEPPA